MRRKFALALTLTAWLLATGAQWDLVQTFAWARMFTANVRVLPLVEAASLTFSPESRCEICDVVAAAKHQQEKSSALPKGRREAKFFLLHHPAPTPAVVAPESRRWSPSDPVVHTVGREAPALRPPRA